MLCEDVARVALPRESKDRKPTGGLEDEQRPGKEERIKKTKGRMRFRVQGGQLPVVALDMRRLKRERCCR